MVLESFTLTSPAQIALVSVWIAFLVIAIPRPSANLNAMNQIFGLATHGIQDTAAGTGIIISGMSVPTVGAVALL